LASSAETPAPAAELGEPPPGVAVPAASARHNIPAATASFVGRGRELAEVSRLLGTTRLLTLTGAGGCGKTRLAYRVADDALATHPDGVWVAELAPLADADLIAPALVAALGLREQPGRPLLS